MKKMPFHLLLIALVGLAAYSNTFSVPFQFDDIWNVAENPVVKDLGNFTSSLIGYRFNPRRYIGYLTLALNYRYGGPEVTGYHIVNLGIHIANALLVYFLVLLIFRTPYFKETGIRNQGLGTGNEKQKTETGETIYNFQSSIPSPQSPVPNFIALFSALLFVSHPIQTQAVTYIVQRFTSLATTFYLLSVVTYIKGRLLSQRSAVSGQRSEEDNRQSDDSRFTIHDSRSTITWYLLSLLCAVLAMKTKEIAFTLPAIIILCEFTFFRSPLKKKLLFLIPVLLTLAIIPMSLLHSDKSLGDVLSDLSEKTRIQTNISRGDYLMTEMRVIATYLRLIFLPVNQNLDYDYPINHSFLTPPVFLSFLLLASLFGAAVWLMFKSQRALGDQQSADSNQRKEEDNEGSMGSCQRSEEDRRQSDYSRFTFHDSRFTLYRLAAFGVFWFFITLSVESSFIPIADVIFEHRVYLPSVGFFIAITAAVFVCVNRFAAHRAKSMERSDEKSASYLLTPLRFSLCALLILVLGLSAASYKRNSIWRDNLGLWEDVVSKAPANARAHNNLCFIYNERGRVNEAMKHCREAVRLRPGYLDARVNLGIVYNAKGMADAAIAQFMTALRLNPSDADAHNNLGIAYVSKGMLDQAIAHYLTAVKLDPDYPEAYNNLGVAYGSKGMTGQAMAYFRHAIRLKPDYFEPGFNIGILYLKNNDKVNAYKEYTRLAGIDPERASRLAALIRSTAD